MTLLEKFKILHNLHPEIVSVEFEHKGVSYRVSWDELIAELEMLEIYREFSGVAQQRELKNEEC